MPRLEIDFGDVREWREQDRVLHETSDERFDRLAFAQRALDLVNPHRTRIAVFVDEGKKRRPGHMASVRVESGRAWGRGEGARWAILSIPARASRRAIAMAVSELSGAPLPYALDVLIALSRTDSPDGEAGAQAPSDASRTPAGA